MKSRIIKTRHSAFEQQATRCYYCRFPMWNTHAKQFAKAHSLTHKEAKMHRCTAEHLVARCAGGTNEPSNIVAACVYCNQRRHYVPRPLDPTAYTAYVRRELSAGGWHGHLASVASA